MPHATEAANRAASQELSAILRHSPFAVFTQDLNGIVRSWNARAEKIFGYTEAEMLGRSASVLFVPGRPEPVLARMRGVAAGAAADEIETCWRMKSGARVDVAVTLAPVFDDRAKTVAICAMVRTYAAEEHEAQELSLALDLAPVMVRGVDGTILTWTTGMAELYGYLKTEAFGRISHQLLHTRFPEPLEAINQDLSRTGTWSGELEHRCKDGRPIWVASTWTLHRHDPPTLIEVNFDITERKRAEQEIRRLNAELERRVEERTEQLLENNRELEAFAYTISHDLRSPLRSMEGFSQALLEDYGDRIDATATDYVRRIAHSAGKMDTLIQDLLGYSRLSRADLKIEPVDLTSVVRSAMEQLEPRAGSIRVREPLGEVLGNRSILVQIVANLISNALKFHAQGVTPKVSVFCGRGNGSVRLTVEDNGIGIDPKFQQQIFQVFSRLHGAEAFPGTGIGLAIVRKGIERLGGHYGVESQSGSGSRFWFELPEAGGDAIPQSDRSSG